MSVQSEDGLKASVEMDLMDLECWFQQVTLGEEPKEQTIRCYKKIEN